MQEIAPRAYVSLSFGKQSLILAHMLYGMAPETPMYFLASSETWLMHDYAAVIASFLERWPVRLTIVQTNHAALDIDAPIAWLSEQHSSIRWEMRPPGSPTWTWKESRDAGDRDLQEMVERTDFDGWYWGLAKEESRARAITLSTRWKGQPHPAIFRYTDGKYRCCPLMHWKTVDLAAYIATHDLPMLDAYRIDGLDTRTTARIRRRPVENGVMGQIRRYNGDSFNRLIDRFPELRSAT